MTLAHFGKFVRLYQLDGSQFFNLLSKVHLIDPPRDAKKHATRITIGDPRSFVLIPGTVRYLPCCPKVPDIG